MKIKVSIADDHPVVLNGLQKILAGYSNIELLDLCANGKELLKCLKVRQPDVILLDIQMPGQDGIELSAIIKEVYPAIEILALTNLELPFQVRNMLANGALGYVLKSATPEMLVEAIETVYKGKQFIDASLKDGLFQELLNVRNTSIPAITLREKEILQLIANEFTSQEIADKLFISYRTVETHRLNLLLKLGVRNSVGLVKKAIQLKLIENERP